MDSIHIQGGIALQGKVPIQGSKNAVLPILAATLLTREISYIYNCPRIADVHRMLSLLRSLGCFVRWKDGGICVNAENIHCGDMPAEAITGMRSSICLLGALLGSCKEVVMEHPGGCIIGERPIDLHISALTEMGVVFREEEGKLRAFAKQLHGADIVLPFPSVGATENILLAAVTAEGDTQITGAAMEPEVEALCRYLECCGADIEGTGTSQLVIKGGRKLYGTDYYVPSDRIVAGTYLLGCVGTGGDVFLEKAPWEQMEAVLMTAKQMGAECTCTEEGIYVQAPKVILPIEYLKTEVYPGFPTDLQSIILAVLTRAAGMSVIEETIFENRFRVLEPLLQMGADIERLGRQTVQIKGVASLRSGKLAAKELRGGAALVVAGLIAEGESVITDCSYIFRGYENICKDLRELGARIVSG